MTKIHLKRSFPFLGNRIVIVLTKIKLINLQGSSCPSPPKDMFLNPFVKHAKGSAISEIPMDNFDPDNELWSALVTHGQHEEISG